MTQPAVVPIIGDGVVVGTVQTGPVVIVTPTNAQPGQPGIVLPGTGAPGPPGAPGAPGLDGEDGRGLESAIVREGDGHLVLVYSDGQVSDLGRVTGISPPPLIFRQQFASPSTVWTVQHGLNTDSPLVEVWDQNDEQYWGDVSVIDPNLLTVEFYLPTAGRVTVKG